MIVRGETYLAGWPDGGGGGTPVLARVLEDDARGNLERRRGRAGAPEGSGAEGGRGAPNGDGDALRDRREGRRVSGGPSLGSNGGNGAPGGITGLI